MKTLTWDQFTNNVQQWANDRGIYQYSTPEAQLLKALSELGELADAIIKNDRQSLKDGIGDVAVCIVNYACMEDVSMDMGDIVDAMQPLNSSIESVAAITQNLGLLLDEEDDDITQSIIASLMRLCDYEALHFSDCYSLAWHEIKDRKGRVVAGGAFVKEC